jgi:hypothetical protein
MDQSIIYGLLKALSSQFWENLEVKLNRKNPSCWTSQKSHFIFHQNKNKKTWKQNILLKTNLIF